MKSLLPRHGGNPTLERLAHLLGELPAVLWEANGQPGTPTFRMEYVSEFARKLLRHPIERWLDEPDFWIEIVHPDDRAHVVDEMLNVYQGAAGATTEFRWQSADGEYLWAEAQMTVLRDASSEPCGLRGVLLDITARKLAEAKSRENEARFRCIFQSNVLPICHWYRDGRIVDANDLFLSLVGYSHQELREGKVNWIAMTPPEYAEADRRAIEEIRCTNRCTPFEKECRTKGGQRVPVLVGLVPLPGLPDCTLGYVLDMSHLRRAQAASMEAKDLQMAVLHSLKEQVAILDRNGMILEVNEAWRQYAAEGGIKPVFRWEGRSYLEACHPKEIGRDDSGVAARAGILAVLRGESALYQEEYRSHTDNHTRWFEMTVVPLRRREGGAIVSHGDISARKEAEIEARSMREQLAHVTRTNALSELSGALAHELNQPLTAILASAQAAERYLARGTDVTRELQELLPAIVAQSVRGGEIIKRVLSMSRKQTAQFQRLSINETVLETLRLLNSDFVTKKITVQTNLEDGLPTIYGDPVQIQQALLNLIVNGCEAMAANQAPERILTIQTFTLKRGFVALSICDLGTGLNENLLQQAFNPFITTKCQGLGLGLSICRTIVESHSGEIGISNNPDRGATVQLRLPAGREVFGMGSGSFALKNAPAQR